MNDKNVVDKKFIVVLEEKLSAIREERESLKPYIERYESLSAQLELLARTRNAFLHEPNTNHSRPQHTHFLPETSAARISQRGYIGNIILEVLRADGQMHIDKLVHKLNLMGVDATKNAVVGVLGRAMQLGQIERLPDGVYKVPEKPEIGERG